MPLYISLHSAHPQSEGLNELSYAGYARAPLMHADVTVGTRNITNCREVNFPKCHDDTNQTARHYAVRTAATGFGHVLTPGGFDAPLKVKKGMTPGFLNGDLTVWAHSPENMQVLIGHLTEPDQDRPAYLDRFRVFDEEDGRITVVDLNDKVCCVAKRTDDGWLGVNFVDEEYKPRLKTVGLFPTEHALVEMLNG